MNTMPATAGPGSLDQRRTSRFAPGADGALRARYALVVEA